MLASSCRRSSSGSYQPRAGSVRQASQLARRSAMADTKTGQSSPARRRRGFARAFPSGSTASAMRSRIFAQRPGRCLHQLQQAETGDAVARILGKRSSASMSLTWALSRNQAAEFHEGNVAGDQLDLELRAVMRGAEQDRLRFEGLPGLAVFQNAGGDVARLVALVAHDDELRPLPPGLALAPQILGETLLRLADHRIGGGEHRLRRAVIAIERDDPRRRREAFGKIEDVAHGGGAEGIDGLGVVADDGEAEPSGFSARRIVDCRRLVSWYSSTSTWSKRSPMSAAMAGFGCRLRPPQEQVVVVEHVLALLGFHIGGEQVAQLRRPFAAPRKMYRESASSSGCSALTQRE